jgi:hypothetical protein
VLNAAAPLPRTVEYVDDLTIRLTFVDSEAVILDLPRGMTVIKSDG